MRINNRGFRSSGFTLIELMVTLAVLAILAVIAIPPFIEFRERAAVRGAGEQLVSFWADARLEALKRNQLIAVSVHTSGDTMCMGASTVSTGCDCFTANDCDVAQYPGTQVDWMGTTPVGNPTLGPDDTDTDGLALIDPKRGYLDDEDDVGGITIQSPRDHRYRLRFYVDRWARAYLCAPTDSPLIPSEYSNRTCAP
jgi:type IV fimbrial biogenesis protein FimT